LTAAHLIGVTLNLEHAKFLRKKLFNL